MRNKDILKNIFRKFKCMILKFIKYYKLLPKTFIKLLLKTFFYTDF